MSDHERREPAAEEEHHHNDENEERASDLENHDEEASHDSEEKGGKKSKYDRGGPHPIIGLIVYVILQFIALLLVTVATPLGMFKLDDEWRDKIYPELAGNSDSICMTAWGAKLGCNTKDYYHKDYVRKFCYRVRTDFKMIQAFCILTISFMLIGLLTGIASIFQKASKGSTGSLGCFAMVLCIIPWGILAGMYNQHSCCETYDWYLPNQTTVCDFSPESPATGVVPPFKDMASFGPSFGLLVAAWVIQLIATILAFVPI